MVNEWIVHGRRSIAAIQRSPEEDIGSSVDIRDEAYIPI